MVRDGNFDTPARRALHRVFSPPGNSGPWGDDAHAPHEARTSFVTGPAQLPASAASTPWPAFSNRCPAVDGRIVPTISARRADRVEHNDYGGVLRPPIGVTPTSTLLLVHQNACRHSPARWVLLPTGGATTTRLHPPPARAKPSAPGASTWERRTSPPNGAGVASTSPTSVTPPGLAEPLDQRTCSRHRRELSVTLGVPNPAFVEVDLALPHRLRRRANPALVNNLDLTLAYGSTATSATASSPGVGPRRLGVHPSTNVVRRLHPDAEQGSIDITRRHPQSTAYGWAQQAAIPPDRHSPWWCTTARSPPTSPLPSRPPSSASAAPATRVHMTRQILAFPPVTLAASGNPAGHDVRFLTTRSPLRSSTGPREHLRGAAALLIQWTAPAPPAQFSHVASTSHRAPSAVQLLHPRLPRRPASGAPTFTAFGREGAPTPSRWRATSLRHHPVLRAC